MDVKPYALGLTGGIAAGKSEAQRILLEQHVPVLDTDCVAHDVIQPGEEAYLRIVDHFGREILQGDGQISRRRLGEIVFSDDEQRLALNAMVHPEVGRRWREWLSGQSAPLAVISIPLLFECGLQNHFDGTLCVWAPEPLMIKRLLTRGLTESQAKQRIQSQWPVDRKRAASTWSITNDGSLEDLKQQVLCWLHQFLTKPR
ncbi:MAG: dephospho-CoA kinase [Verrucomicrobia bacterium]|nr:dephospho-CoA kinase [Verrucomicrobiota bacterium]MCH8526314.1 dephospho-CoA kinase [Kiritimatiellia bacterium]